MSSALAVDVLVHLRTARFDTPLTYALPDGISPRVGDVVRVPLGTRNVYGYVVSAPYAKNESALRPIVNVADAPRAFDETGLALARFIADRAVCTLGEALGAVVLAGAIPRVEEKMAVIAAAPSPTRHANVPQRLLRLIWDDLRDGFSVEALLRHPEARRAADRSALLRHLGSLVRSGDLARVRTMGGPRLTERMTALLVPGEGEIAGRKAAALVRAVYEAGSLRRSDALLEGYSHAVIARTIASGAIQEIQQSAREARASQGIVRPPLTPSDDQRLALAKIREKLATSSFDELLLYGVTGSGKTLVYLEAIADVVESGGRAIVLVPEISLTPQTARRFEAVFGDRVAVLHSALSQRERYDAWQAAARGEISVVVGARSAIFAPLEDVRLVVVDEAHEGTYRQETTPRYDALAVARERMRLAHGLLILGTATPPLTSYERALRGEIDLVRLPKRASAAAMPEVHVIDMTREFSSGNRRVFSSLLAEAIAARLESGEKTILFVNRRGSAGFILCRGCGYVPECTRCSTSLVVHRSDGLLRCHHCDLQLALAEVCPRCKNSAFREFGIGTEKVAEEVKKLWPGARVVRMDSDTTTRVGDHARILSTFENDADVLVGTQMVAKGLDFPTVTLVGVVAADLGLHVPDYRAAERTFDLIAQVCGRSGRSRPGIAIVQTYSPEHPAIALGARADFDAFAREELEERQALAYPPFGELAYVGVAGRSRKAVEAAVRGYAAILRQERAGEILGPAPLPIARLNEEWRWRVGVKASSLEVMRGVVRKRILPLAHKDRATRLWIAFD
ncbi:MAG TPA: primosomal protein N' [Candidatus Baltobacteraceae bacterium]